MFGEINKDHYKEFTRCKDDIKYFIETYILRNKLTKQQKKVIDKFNEGKSFYKALKRQTGKTTIALSIIIHQSIFKPRTSSNIITINQSMDKRIIENIILMLETLPFYNLFVAFNKRNEKTIEFDNGSIIKCGMPYRGELSTDILYLDEVDHINKFPYENILKSSDIVFGLSTPMMLDFLSSPIR